MYNYTHYQFNLLFMKKYILAFLTFILFAGISFGLTIYGTYIPETYESLLDWSFMYAILCGFASVILPIAIISEY